MSLKDVSIQILQDDNDDLWIDMPRWSRGRIVHVVPPLRRVAGMGLGPEDFERGVKVKPKGKAHDLPESLVHPGIRHLPPVGRDKIRMDVPVFTISANAKTGMSVSALIGDAIATGVGAHHPGSCNPTDWCKANCYARVGRQAEPQSVILAWRNSLIFDRIADAPMRDVADLGARIIKSMRKNYDNLRWWGVGDFTPGGVRLFNAMTEWAQKNDPSFLNWGFSRRADMIRRLVPRHNMHLNVSMDMSTPGVTGEGKKTRGGILGPDGIPQPWHVSDLWKASTALRRLGVCDFVWADSLPASRALHACMKQPWAPAILFGLHQESKKAGPAARSAEWGKYYWRPGNTRISMDYAPPFTGLQCPATMKWAHGFGWCQACRFCMSKGKRIASTALEQYRKHRSKYAPMPPTKGWEYRGKPRWPRGL